MQIIPPHLVDKQRAHRIFARIARRRRRRRCKSIKHAPGGLFQIQTHGHDGDRTEFGHVVQFIGRQSGEEIVGIGAGVWARLRKVDLVRGKRGEERKQTREIPKKAKRTEMKQ